MLRSTFCVILFVLIALTIPRNGWSQDSLRKISNSAKTNLSTAADEIEALINSKASPLVIGKKYEEVAQQFKLKNQNDKAITYYQKALTYYKKAKSKADIARVHREIGKIQEESNNKKAASENYSEAARNAPSAMNSNDVKRVAAPTPSQQMEVNSQTINLLTEGATSIEEKSDDIIQMDVNDVSFAYANQAKLNAELGKTEAALQYNMTAQQVLETSSNTQFKTKEIIDLKADRAEILASSGNYNDAIQVAEEGRKDALNEGNMNQFVEISSRLANLHLEANQTEKAILILKDTYRTALSSGSTRDARLALKGLIDFFSAKNEKDDLIFYYQDFVNQLDELISRDSTLLDEKIFFAKEDRILQLEKERDLQDKVLLQSRRFNYGMIAFFTAVLLASLFLYLSLRKVRMQNKKIALQSLRREMNPHFIFNSLNSVNRFIAQNDEIKANNYLTSYAQLMRTTMEISSQDFIRLDKEIELLRKYLELEYMRFSQHFDYSIEVEESINFEEVQIPGFLIQPHLENAIWHGLRYKGEKGKLTLKFEEKGNQILVQIEDDGIGVEESQKLKTQNQKSHNSRGFSNIKERIELLNSLYNFRISLDLQSPCNEKGGTRVLLTLPKISNHE